jgi:hypothetical protein
MKSFDSTKSKYSYLVQATSLLTNFMQYKGHMDFIYEVIGDQNVDMVGLRISSYRCKKVLTLI